jgi:hypothetical protein
MFKFLFYETDSFNINPAARNTPSLKYYVSLLPDARTTTTNEPFSLLNEIYNNILNSLHIGIESIEPASQMILNKEVSSIKSLCNLQCQSLVNALRWTDIINMTQNDPQFNYDLPLNISITLVFASSTEGVPDLNVIMNYSVSGFQG